MKQQFIKQVGDERISCQVKITVNSIKLERPCNQ